MQQPKFVTASAMLALMTASCVTPQAGSQTATVTVGDAQTTEGRPAVVPVTISGGGKAKVNFTTGAGTATDNADFFPMNGTIVSGGSTAITVGTVDDANVEQAETFTVTVTAKNTATIIAKATGTVTIADNDLAPPQPITCWDGSVVIPPATCPPEPPKPPSGDIFVPSLDGLTPINSVDPMLASKPASVPGTAAPDYLGAFRFTCGFAGLGRFDPKVYPGDTTGKSHGHQFYSNTGITPFSSYDSLRTSGSSTCAYGQYPGNRSAYWQPWLEDGRGHVLQPDYVTLYYKRRPLSDPACSDPKNFSFAGTCVAMPHGLFFIFGFDFLTNTPATGNFDFTCQLPNNGALFVFKTLAEAAASGKCVAGGLFSSRGGGPKCWDGKRADSTNHRDHVAPATVRNPNTGQYSCDAAHPYVIPEISVLSTWSIAAGDDVSLWRFSSDAMRPELPAGSTFHVDFFMNWEPGIKTMWTDACIDKLLNCSGGNLGNGRQLNAASVPFYPPVGGGAPVSSWTNPYRVVPIPGAEANTKLVGMPNPTTFAGQVRVKGKLPRQPLNRAAERFERLESYSVAGQGERGQ
jgi:Domain of unknown function (DUF1996)/Calx-beta domain